jgi:predicted DCC family thiol-disulfide oxidoreductase YuxK
MPDTPAASPDHLFYDGTCALCHGAVKFALRHDVSGQAFRFAPLQGPTFERLIDPSTHAALPDSVVILTSSGAVHTRSDAIVHMLKRVGGTNGGWHALGNALAAVPRPIRDAAYSVVAAVRYKIFGRKSDLCPVMTAKERERFDP